MLLEIYLLGVLASLLTLERMSKIASYKEKFQRTYVDQYCVIGASLVLSWIGCLLGIICLMAITAKDSIEN